MPKKDDNGKIALKAFLRLTGKTHPNSEAEIMQQLDNFVETLHRMGIDYKAVVLVDHIKENNSERTKGRLNSPGSISRAKGPEEIPRAE